ncbi:MAG: DUF1572 family protein [Bryobacterales bacterium]|nr:DUF1572 family protein [Bryobacterales bacterium]MBV9401959.1 DUF1572 family protein [Bryobacterales bacterium]
MTTLESEFLRFSAAKLEQFVERIEACIGKLTPEQVWMRGTEEQNAAGNLLLHLEGNVRQWILSGIGGAPDHRVRDAEFAARKSDSAPAELVARLKETVQAACETIRGMTAAQLLERESIQGFEGTKLQAIYHVVEHFAGHAFQIMFITKLLTGEDLGFYSYLSGSGRASGQAMTP